MAHTKKLKSGLTISKSVFPLYEQIGHHIIYGPGFFEIESRSCHPCKGHQSHDALACKALSGWMLGYSNGRIYVTHERTEFLAELYAGQSRAGHTKSLVTYLKDFCGTFSIHATNPGRDIIDVWYSRGDHEKPNVGYTSLHPRDHHLESAATRLVENVYLIAHQLVCLYNTRVTE
jgi:hypothetical protein